MARLCGRGFCRLEPEPGKLYSDPSRTPHTLFLPRAKALLIAGVASLQRRTAGSQSIVLDVTGWYWHFMALLWVFILCLLEFVH